MEEPTNAAAGAWSGAGPAEPPAGALSGPLTSPLTSAPDRPPAPVWRRLRGLALWVGVVGLAGLLLFVYHYLAALASRQPRSPLPPFIEELTGAFTGGLLFFPIRWLVRRLPLASARWPRRLPVYFLAMLASGAVATTLMWALRSVLFPLAGLGAYDYGVMPLRYLMELPMQVIWFSILVGAIHAADAFQTARAREVRAARLESSLARAQLLNLRLQLQPHFLFNALHTISAVMYGDPAAADEMLDQLSELLRASLRTAQADEVPLGEELALLDRYLAIQRARFGDRLAVSIQVDAGADSCLVPSLLLQPLVENAIHHGNAERAGRGAIDVRARQQDGRLLLEVEDDGPGVEDDGLGIDRGAGPVPGLGLSATADRLRRLYGDGQSFSAGNGPAGGFLVRVSLPLRLQGRAGCPPWTSGRPAGAAPPAPEGVAAAATLP
jgi:two-component system LytT family sensor kinase